ncbi:cytoplasmic phosphatidylinositol transfer protein 1-like isoform X1 [Salvelinus fontinalis]|uniref:cytoplasmic phosphatidylinositol transfer protein 1-like isoform X1 n=2 Tax=Salvelinus fontinalis TaxID=8038 RepID=UPI0024855E8E|nr:cytoplasmic phosphatidylinositol transfer protein 1-like isoform X1 [Salvelinus fontinalis]
MLLKEYRICMPLTVEEYRIGQLYMISKHSHEQSDRGEGVEVVQNEPFEDPAHGQGQFTEKRVYLNSKLPSWARAVVPNIFYVTEKAWNYYPYTITEYTCSFLPKFSIHIETKYEDNKGSNDNAEQATDGTQTAELGTDMQGQTGRDRESQIFSDSDNKDQEREVCFVDIAYDEIPERYYKESEDLRYFKSEKTSRGMLQEGWRDTQEPIMCSYKLVTVKFEVWGLQTRVEQFVHKVVRDVLLLGHRQAFAWVDEWIDMTMDEVREYERTIQEATNEKIGIFPPPISISEMPLSSCTLSGPASAPTTPLCSDAPEFLSVPKDRARKKSAPETLTLPDAAAQNQSGVPQGSMLVPLPNQNHSPWPSSDSDQAELGGE